MTCVLELTDIGRRYGELRAVEEVTLEVEVGSRHALIGPNGAGKSTLFNLISGTVRPTSGRVRFLGTDVFFARDLPAILRHSVILRHPPPSGRSLVNNCAG